MTHDDSRVTQNFTSATDSELQKIHESARAVRNLSMARDERMGIHMQ